MSSKIAVRNVILLLALVALFFAHRGTAVAASTPAGFVENLERTVTIMREGHESELDRGSGVNTFDIIETGMMGYAMIKLIDGTLIELGPNSEAYIVDIAFMPDTARLHIDISRGVARLRTGSIGLKNPFGINITTPRSVVTASNCELIFGVEDEAETMDIVWMPKGPKVSVFNVGTGDLLEVKRSHVVVSTDIDNNMSVADIEYEEYENEE
ncbi:MAG: FecR family protein [Synergistaceae bacterium]|jgi:hypothetical protein|nr:FecR family protein [Synergistaceae bacterium]